MNKRVISVTPETTILDALEVMRLSQIRRLPILENDKLVGIVTDSDLRETTPSMASTLSKYEASYLLSKMKVKEIMTKKPYTVSANATIEEVALIMYKHRIGGVPVVDGNDSDKLVGIVTETDIFKVLVDMMGLPQGKTRLTLVVPERTGVLAEIGTIFRDMGLSVTSFVVLDSEHSDTEKEIVLRGDFTDTELIKEKLEERDFKVIDITKIS